MAISQKDLAILKTQNMTDTAEGGGLPTAVEVVDGLSNDVMPDVSDLDRLYGKVRLRKLALAVQTPNNDMLQAARMLFTELPDNDNVSVFAFKSTSFADERTDAQNKIESYLTPGIRWAGHVLENQLAGQRVIQISLSSSDAVPKVGKALVIIQNEGQTDEFYQYIRPVKVDTVVRSFVRSTNGGSNETVNRAVATIEFSEALSRSFSGLTVAEFYSNISTARRAILREAQVSDAAKYYSASRLAEPVTALGTRQVRLNSIFVQVVPASTTETALPLIDPVGQSSTLVRASDGTININKSVSVSPSTPWQIGSTIYPSSLTLTISGITMTDADGELKDNAGNIYASVDYSSGLVTWYNTANFGIQTVVGSFTPASALMRVMQSEVIYTPETGAGSSYLRQLQAKPSPSSMRVSFQVGGSVTTVRDDGRGNLINDDGTAYGILDYENSIVQLVLPAIPDSESAIVFTYSTDLGTVSVGGQTVKGSFDFTVSAYVPNTATVTWGSKAATISDGTISGDATGYFDGTRLHIEPNELPAVDTVFTIEYESPSDTSQTKRGTQSLSATYTAGNRINRFTSNIGPIDAGTFGAFFKVIGGTWSSIDSAALPQWLVYIKDDAEGNILFASKSYDYAVKAYTDEQFNITGTIDYQTGDIVIDMIVNANAIDVTSQVTDTGGAMVGNFTAKEVSYTNSKSSMHAKDAAIELTYSASFGVTNTVTTTLTRTAEMLNIAIPAATVAPVVAGSVSVLAAHDVNGGMVRGGVNVGAVDYSKGVVSLTAWDVATNSITIDSAVREFAVPPVSALVFRTASAPVKIGEFTLNLRVDGQNYSITADEDGNISGTPSYFGDILDAGISGFIDYQTGVVAVYGNNIDPELVTYTGMAYSYLPLDKELIGLDPVRLPLDGRVPFVRKGDSVAITEQKTMQLPTNAVGDAFDLGFERLSDVSVVDATGARVTDDELNIDLDAGTLQLNDMFDESQYTAPLIAKYRIMDIGLVTETDISGRITLSNVITHDYTTAAVCSSMLLAGDMQAMVSNVFSQKSWGSKFSDELIGDATTAQLQPANAPIVVTNRDAIEERWALVFTSATDFRIIGEAVGEIGTGSTLSDTSPVNWATGYPYFTIPAAAWSGGWAVNNVARLNTHAAKYMFWLGSAIQQHQGSSQDTYDFTIGYHANIDRAGGAA